MKVIVAALIVALAPCASSSGAEDHLVTRAIAAARLVDAGERRHADLAFLEARVGSLSPMLHRLGDDELRDLALRAAALESDPAATGPSGAMITLLIVVAVVLLAGMVLELT